MSRLRMLVFTGFVALAGCRDEEREVAVSNVPLRELEIAPEDTASPVAAPADSAATPDVRRTRSGARAAERVDQPKRRPKPPARKRPKPPTTAEVEIASDRRGSMDTLLASRPTPVEPASPDTVEPSSPTIRPPVPAPEVSESAATRAPAAPAPPAEASPTPSPAAAPAPAPEQPVRTPPAAAPTPATNGAEAQPETPAPAPAPSGATVSAPPPADMHALPTGTHLRALIQDSIHSLRNSVGQTVTALVSGDMRAPDGRTLVPSGSVVRLTITRLKPARTRNAVDGELDLRADSVIVGGRAYAIRAEVQPVPHELKGRGVDAGAAEKVAAGAAVGAVAGGVITRKTKGAVVGGVIGAAGGAVVAAHTASRDVVVTPRTLVVLTLTSPFAAPAAAR